MYGPTDEDVDTKAQAADARRVRFARSRLILTLLMISQFIAFFNYTKLPRVAAVEMAHILERAGLGALPLLIGLIFVTLLLDIIIPGVVPK